MADDTETISLRPTIVDGVRQDDDYDVVWRGIPVGRIMRQYDSRQWWWGCNVYGRPPTTGDRGPAIDFKDGQVRFKLAWARVRPTLTTEEIAVATRHAEGLERQTTPEAQQAGQDAVQILENNRAALRQRVLKAGTIEFNGGAIDCVVRNISETGAALEVTSPVGIPEIFNLLILGDHTKRQCQVAWRTDKRIGIKFN
ncbi:PilZ domain-containing protein [Bradyrhizobium erythrophlei]|uniref:PilZ domain-containing protein n=1 Tax=Bradyrhizobium erythrophlei TaxID=1437360 RepID=UPI0035ED4FF1